jgi:hypothetical protein
MKTTIEFTVNAASDRGVKVTGFDSWTAADKVNKLLASKGIVATMDNAEFRNSHYLEGDLDVMYFDIRIADHTKRSDGYKGIPENYICYNESMVEADVCTVEAFEKLIEVLNTIL